jgi:hypothetical protein
MAYLGFQCLDNPPYSPYLAPLDYHLFPGLKKAIEREVDRAKNLTAPPVCRVCVFVVVVIVVGGTRWRRWLRHCCTSRKVAGSIPDIVIRSFHWRTTSGRSMALGVISGPNKNEYREYCVGVKAASTQDWQPYHLYVKTIEIWWSHPPGTLLVCNRPVKGLAFIYYINYPIWVETRCHLLKRSDSNINKQSCRWHQQVRNQPTISDTEQSQVQQPSHCHICQPCHSFTDIKKKLMSC